LSRPPVCITAAIRPSAIAWAGDWPKTSTGRTGQPQQHIDGGRLARAVRAEEGHHLAGFDPQRDLVHGPYRTEVLAEPGQLDRRIPGTDRR
jgi:hypothetical protein